MIEILRHQAEFIKSQSRHTGLVGGFRSGKSQAGVIKTITKKLAMPKVDVAYYLPTYPLIKDIAFPKFADILTQQEIPFIINKSDKDIHTPYGRIILRSMDNPDLIIGYEVGYSLVDEADVLPKAKMQEVMIKILARNSVKFQGNNNATDFVSTPEGFRFLYDFFVVNASENKKLIQATTKNNPFISEDYIASLTEQYNENQLRAYLDGEFVNLTSGSVYIDYDRNVNHTDITANDKDILFIGMDFNVTNMAAVVHVVENNEPFAVAEITKAYNTEQMCSLIKERYPTNKIIVYPDASGQSRKSSSSETDHDIIKRFGFGLHVDRTNPAIKDRINTMNMMFRKGYKVNKHTCPEYSQSLEQQAYDKNGIPNKVSGFDHLNDAAGYYIVTYRKPKNQVFI